MAFDIELKIEAETVADTGKRWFRWIVSSPSQYPLISRELFATKREAEKVGEVILQRARQRGRIR